MTTDFALDALEQALHARQPENAGELIHHPDRGSPYLSVRYKKRLAEAGVNTSVGSHRDSDDNILAETVDRLYKAEVIRRRGPSKSRQSLELATRAWLARFNEHRLMEWLGHIPPAQAEANDYRRTGTLVPEAA